MRVAGLAVAATAMVACSSSGSKAGTKTTTPSTSSNPTTAPTPATTAGISKIKHVVVIMQENRSFDSYFGTYPGAAGIPAANGKFTVCVPDPKTSGCSVPYHDPADINGGAGHNSQSASAGFK